MEVGATAVHEGTPGAEADLGGVDARVDLGAGIEVKAEFAATRADDTGGEVEGQAWLAEIRKRTPDLDARAYFRERGEDFGLGQQNESEDATRKTGAEATVNIAESWTLSGELYRDADLATDAERDLAETRIEYRRPAYDLFTGLRLVEDRFINDPAERSTQWLVGGSRRFLNDRLHLRLDHEQSLGGENDSVDFPTRTTLGGDYALTESVALYAEHEIALGSGTDSQDSLAGLRASPWNGGQVGSSLGRDLAEDGQRIFANLGLTQTWQIDGHWTVTGGFDRSQTVRKDGDESSGSVSTASGAEEDFTAVSVGAGYKATRWSWNGRLESRAAESEDKWSLTSGLAGEVRDGLGLSAGLQLLDTETDGGEKTFEGDLRLSLAYRPKHSRWIVLDRMDLIFEDQSGGDDDLSSRRIVNNLNANYKPHHDLQVALQYGAKVVLDTIDQVSYAGYTDLTGTEIRFDLNRRWDIGLHASVLHSWSAGQVDYRTGISLGHRLAKNMWLSVGYNLTGFTDEDFSAADCTAAGPFVKFRLKFDQQSVREMLDRPH
jgi:hypothetical protein